MPKTIRLGSVAIATLKALELKHGPTKSASKLGINVRTLIRAMAGLGIQVGTHSILRQKMGDLALEVDS